MFIVYPRISEILNKIRMSITYSFCLKCANLIRWPIFIVS